MQLVSILTVHLTLSAVSFTARTVTSSGGLAGGAWIVSNHSVGRLGGDLPAMFTAMIRNLEQKQES